jgi:hypothetical protein
MNNTQGSLRELITVPAVAALSFLLLTVLTAGRYGFYGDELYYIACSKHLDWGYVDHPPFVAFLTMLSTWIFGETLIGIRFLSGLAGAVTVILSARIAGMLGGGKFSQALASLSICFASAFPALSSFFSMNPVDIMLCTLFMYMFSKTTTVPSPQRWITLGVLLGVGLLNKYTFLVLGFSLLLSLIIGLNPFTLPLWLSGLLYLLLSKDAKQYRFLGWTAVVFVLVYVFQNSKFYYVLPVFPLLLGAGAVAIERFSQRYRRSWPGWVVGSAMIVSGTMLMPLAVPLLPVSQFVSYAKTLGLWNAIRMQKNEGDTLPLHFVYRFGWQELVDSVATAYNRLPQDERGDCAILASWYGIAGAIDHFGPAHGLPGAICPNNNYWIWGTRNYTGKTVLAVGYDAHSLEPFFDSVEPVTYVEHPYAYDVSISLCKAPKAPLDELWLRSKRFF